MKKVFLFLTVCLVALVSAEEYNNRNDNYTSEVLKNEFQLVSSASEGENLFVKVIGYDNTMNVYRCMVLFKNAEQGKYKLVAPWGEMYINIRDVREITIQKTEVE